MRIELHNYIKDNLGLNFYVIMKLASELTLGIFSFIYALENCNYQRKLAS